MKKLLTILPCFLLLAIGCNKVEEQLPAVELTASKSQITVTEYVAQTAVAYSWTSSEGDISKYQTSLQFSANKNNFSKFNVNVKATSYDLTFEEVKFIMDELGKEESFTLYARVAISASEGKEQYSNIVEVNVDIDVPPSIPTLYVTGSACAAGWTYSDERGNKFTAQNGKEYDIYQWTGSLDATGEFRFNTTTEDWFPGIVLDIETEKAVYVKEWDATVYKPFTVETTGIYDVVVDLRDPKNIEYSLTLKEEGPEYPTVYITGAACPAGWTQSDEEGNKLIARNGQMRDIYEWSGELVASEEFRFNTTVGNWFPAIVLEKTTQKAVYVKEWDATIYDPFHVEVSGEYNIELDLRDHKNITYTFTLVNEIPDEPEQPVEPDEPEVPTKPEIPTVYLNGDACPAGWTQSDEAGNKLTAKNGEMYDVYEWSGELLAGGAFRFNTKIGDWFPAIVIDKATQKPVYVEEWDENLYETFSVEVTGIYNVVLDICDFDNITCTITLVTPTPVFEKAFLLGDAAPSGWALTYDGGNLLTAMNGKMRDIYEWTGVLNAAPAGFRVNFILTDWFPSIMQRVSDGKAVFVSNEEYNANSAAYAHFTVAETGTYTVTFDLRDMTNISFSIVNVE